MDIKSSEIIKKMQSISRLSNKELANALQVDEKLINEIKEGKKISIEELVIFCNRLNCQMNEIIDILKEEKEKSYENKR